MRTASARKVRSGQPAHLKGDGHAKNADLAAHHVRLVSGWMRLGELAVGSRGIVGQGRGLCNGVGPALWFRESVESPGDRRIGVADLTPIR